MSPPVLGIDFGTTNTVVAVVTEDGCVEVLENGNGSRMTPSVVHIDPSDPLRRQVGEAALKYSVEDPLNTIRNVKRVLGYPPEVARQVRALCPVKVVTSEHGDAVAIRLGDNKAVISPEEVVAMILLDAKKAARRQLGVEVSKAVIAVPCYFTAAQRCAIQDAAFLADLEVVEIVNETTAAALAYAYDREYSKTVLIVDVGGGGSCVSVVRVENNAVSVLACSTRQPGGENFDSRMVEYLKKVVVKQHQKEISEARTLEILRLQWVEAKRKLAQLPQTTIQTFLPEIKTDFCQLVTRTDFDDVCGDLFNHIFTAIELVLSNAKIQMDKLDDVVLVGGSTRTLKLRKLIKEVTGNKLCKAVNPDEAVARGAALLGAKRVVLQDEVLGLYSIIKITAKDYMVNKETKIDCHWNNSATLPLCFSMKSIYSTAELEIQQGHGPITTIPICKIPTPPKLQSIIIDKNAQFSFRYLGRKNSLRFYLRGCIPEANLKCLKEKMIIKNSHVPLVRPKFAQYTEKCMKELDWLDQHADAGERKLDEICMKMYQMIQKESMKEKQRLQEKSSFKEVLDIALDMKIVEDDFKDRLSCLKETWRKESEWLSHNSQASAENFQTRKENVIKAKTALIEDCIQKQKDNLKVSIQMRLRGTTTFADDKQKTGDNLDYEWGTQLKCICHQINEWLKNHATTASVDELKTILPDLEKQRFDTETKFKKLKYERELKRKEAYRNAEHAVLQGLNLEVSEYEAVLDATLHFKQICKEHLKWLKNNSNKDAKSYSRIKNIVDYEFDKLKTRRITEIARLKTKIYFRRTLEEARQQADEPLCSLAQDCWTWLEQNPGATEERMKKLVACVREARGNMEDARKHAKVAGTAKGRAEEAMRCIAEDLGLQLKTGTGPADVEEAMGADDSEDGCTLKDYSVVNLDTTGANDKEGERGNGGAATGLPLAAAVAAGDRQDPQAPQAPQAQGTPQLAADASRSASPASPSETTAVQALESAARAGSMSLLLSRAAAGGRAFISLAVRYLEESGLPVERLLVVKELVGDAEAGDGRLVLDTFVALLRKARFLNWGEKLMGVCVAGSGAAGQAFLAHLKETSSKAPQELECGAVRLDERLVQVIHDRASSSPDRVVPGTQCLSDFFSTIDALRSLLSADGRWFKVLMDKCRSLQAGHDPWRTYSSAFSFVSDERKLGLPQALQAVSKSDPTQRLLVDSIREKMAKNSFIVSSETCKELFRTFPGYEDELMRRSASLSDLLEYLNSAFKLPKDLSEHLTSVAKVNSAEILADKSKYISEMCHDTTQLLVDSWKMQWAPLFSLLTAICNVHSEDTSKRPSTLSHQKCSDLQRDVATLHAQFPGRLSSPSLQAMVDGLPRAQLARDFPALHKAFTEALTAPLLPPQGLRAKDQLRATTNSPAFVGPMPVVSV